MSERSDGLIDYTLSRDYGDNKAGTVIPVDPERKKWLDENGYRRTVRRIVSDLPVPPTIEELP